jgi:hypothetical protein
MSDDNEKKMSDEEVREDSKRRMKEAVERLREVFAVARMTSTNDGHRLAFAIMEDAMTEGMTVADAKRKYVDNTTESMRRDAAGIVFLLAQMSDKLQDVLAALSGKLGDSFAKKMSLTDLIEDFDCGNPNCPVHGKNAVKAGDILRPDQLSMLPPVLAAGFAELMKEGLIVKHVGQSGPVGAVEIHGPKHLLAKADALMNAAGKDILQSGDGPLPAALQAEMNKQPLDSHTQEISDALDRAFGRDRTHLPKKDIPLS